MLFKHLFYFILFTILLYQITSSVNTISDCINNFPSEHYCYAKDNDYDYIVSEIGKQSGETSNSIKYPQIKISDNCIGELKNLSPGGEIAVGRLFKISNSDSSIYNKITDIIAYQFFHLNGNTLTQINGINICGNEDISYYLPIYTNDNTLVNKYMNVFRQNPDNDEEDTFLDYDIFNPNADIYNDICTTITFSEASENTDDSDEFVNYDITLHERRKYYFPGNTKLCPKNFNYKGIDKETFSAICQTKISSETSRIINIGTDSNPVDHDFTSFKADSDFKKEKRDIYFSMDVFKCIKLPFTFRGFKGNYGSYFMIALMIIVVICYLILLIAGKIHLLSVLELLYNSNIQSMNYLKQNNNIYNNSLTNNNNQIISYDVRSNNNQTLASNGQLLSNVLVGSNYLYNPNVEKISIPKKSNNNKKNEMIKENTKKGLMSKVDEQENDFESEKPNEEQNKTEINNNDNKDVDIINVKDKNKNKKNKEKEKEKENDLIKEKEEKEEKVSKNSSKSKKEEEDEDDDDEDENNESNEESESNKSNKDKDEDKSSKEKDDKANPPKKKNENGGEDENDEEEEDNGKKEKKKKSKNPIEISLNVKDLRDMMFKNQFPPQSETMKETDKKSKAKSKEEKLKSKPKKKNNKNTNNNNINNGINPNNFNNNIPPNFPFPPYLPPPPLGMMPPYGMPPQGYPYNGGGSPYNDENQKLKKELEYQKELNERRDREMRREREDLMERERERQRQRDYDMDRERRLRDMDMMYGNNNVMQRLENMLKNNNNKNGMKRGSALWNDDSDLLLKEREKFNREQDKFNRIKEKLEDEIEKKKEENEKITKDLNLIREEQRVKQIEHEKELLKTNQELKEKFEKEKKEIIDTKDREMKLLKEDKDREIQKLKEDKDREINLLKQDMKTQMKKKDDAIKKKDKVIEKQKKETKELKKDLTTNNTFYTNMNATTFRQNYNSEMNNNLYKKDEEKIDSPQVVVSINSIFTDQELNAMDFEQSCQFDKRSLCQVYLSYINRKQPLFFFFNYNNSSSGISIFQINYQSVRFIIICIDFMIYMFIYCSFFGTKSIALIYQKRFNFRRMCILGSIISPGCLIIRSIIHHFVYDPMNKKIAEIKMRCYTNFTVGKKKQEMKINEFKDFWESDGEKNKDEIEKKEEMDEIQDIENDDNLSEGEKARRKDKYEKRRLKQLIKEVIASFQKKVLISFIIMIFVLFFVWIYVSCFCAVYKNSQLKFFVSIIVCYGFSNLFPFVYCLLPTIFRQDAVRDESRLSFILANVFQII